MERVKYLKFVSLKFKTNKPYLALLAIFEAFYFATTVYFAVIGQPRDAILAGIFLLIPPLMLFIERALAIDVRTPFALGAVFLLFGSTLGAGYNVYTLFPAWDDILHAYSGFVFGCLGFSLCEVFMGEPKDRRHFAMALFFGFCFCMMIAAVWELFEYLGTEVAGADMQEDALVHSFHSYFLSGTHVWAQEVDGITQTVIYLADGTSITLNGYLDLGLIDTLNDMALCLLGSAFYLIVAPILYFKNKAAFRAFVPQPSSLAFVGSGEYIEESGSASCSGAESC